MGRWQRPYLQPHLLPAHQRSSTGGPDLDASMEPALGDLQDDVIKSRLTGGLDTDVSKWRVLAPGINILLDTTYLYCLFGFLNYPSSQQHLAITLVQLGPKA